jgi:hypothetical protein
MRSKRSQREPEVVKTWQAIAGVFVYLGFVAVAAAQLADARPDNAMEPEAKRYAVEIILFSYTGDTSAGNERFAPEEAEAAVDVDVTNGEAVSAELTFGDIPLPGTDASAAEPPVDIEEIPTPADIELTVLRRDQLTLQDIYEKLSNVDAYRPVLWTGWMQSTHEAEITPSLHLRRIGNAPLQFDGTLKLYLSRFLHLVVDLTMDDEMAGIAESPLPGNRQLQGDDEFAAAAAPGVVRFRISEDSIMKNGDLRYFDHPKFGLLAKVTRVEESLQDMDETDLSGVLPPAPQN